MRLEKDQFLKQKPFNSRMPYAFQDFGIISNRGKEQFLKQKPFMAFLN